MSNLFDESSLAMIPTAYKDGRLYSVRPVQELGDEEVTNGDFATDSNWTKGTGSTISGGRLNHSGATASDTTQIISITEKKYRLEYTITSGSGSVRFWSNINAITPAKQSGVGTYVHYFFYDSSVGTNGRFAIALYDDISIDNVSVKEVLVSGDFTFSRGSNLAATRVDVNGLIEKGRENLLLQSNSFSTSPWFNSNSTETGGQSGYDGSSDAWLISKSAGNGYIGQPTSSSGVQSFSVYAKRNELDWLFIIALGSGYPEAYFDLANGVVGSTINLIDSNIESVGNGWYRCSITFNSSLVQFRIYPADADNDKSGTSGSIYIQDAQLEQGLVATPYIETGASTAQAGILEDLPRLDYSGGASCPSLLLEPSRTNLIESSEYVVRDVFGWDINGAGGITTENNSATSPEGLQNAVKLIYSGSGYSYIRRSLASGAGTISVYVKKGNWRYIGLRNGESQSTHSVFDFDTESFVLERSGHTLGYESVGNGWYRIWDYQPTAVSPANGLRGVAMCDANGTEGSPSTPAGSYNYVWGFQVELGASYPTSYIPTYGSAVTRNIDVCIKYNVENLLGTSSGTVFVDFDIFDTDNYGGIVEIINDSNQNERLLIWVDAGQDLELNISSGIGGTGIEVNNISLGRHKAAFTYSANEIAYFVDGVKIGTTTPTIQTFAFSRYDMRNSQGGVEIQKKHIRQTMAFPTALSDVECIALTTI